MWNKKWKLLMTAKFWKYIYNNIVLLLDVYKNTESENPKVIKAKNGIIMVLLDKTVFVLF